MGLYEENENKLYEENPIVHIEISKNLEGQNE
jgi:hypothetical protein